MKITKENIQNFDVSSRKEWIVTNGIGGYSASSIIGLNTRKYHALLVAALGKSGDRYVVLSKLNESLVFPDKTVTISTNQCSNFIENGYVYQELFGYSMIPEFYYKVNDVEILKKVAMKHGENKVAVSYTIKTRTEDIQNLSIPSTLHRFLKHLYNKKPTALSKRNATNGTNKIIQKSIT